MKKEKIYLLIILLFNSNIVYADERTKNLLFFVLLFVFLSSLVILSLMYLFF